MASSPSSHQQNQEFNVFSGKRRTVCESSRLFDVFINHRGPDVKQTLAIQLYDSLHHLGIGAFLDSQEKKLGHSFPSTIQTAIQSASVHVAIFSKGYADSAWCLAELVLMLESQAKIIPVFYGVKPSDLRYIETGAYAEAFIKYKEKGRYLEKLKEWKEALQSLSLIAGEESNSFSEGDCQNIVEAVQKEVQRKRRLHVAKYPVGLSNLVKDIERRCLKELVQDFKNQCGLKKGKDKAKVVGIFGIGGAGKTTLAKELFNQKRWNYCKASFLFDVREASERRELPSLQLKLLKDLFDRHDLFFTSIEEGTSYLKDSLQRSPTHLSVLIVVDDVDHIEQLDALLVTDILNKLNDSLVIITTRDVGVLISAGITTGYPLKGMDRNYGSELFCWHAFDQPYPLKGYEELVNSFLDMCRGLPLSLQVLGRHVRGRSEDYWRSELNEVRKVLPRDVKQSLRISFDALNAKEKNIFMDIACFFSGREQSMAERVWEGSGWKAQHALKTLRDKCLVEEGYYLRMHDHLRDLGREMALELSPPHRLWRPQDLEYSESGGFRNILAKTNVRCFHSIFDKRMNSRVTFFLGPSHIWVETSASLLWLQLEGNFRRQPMKTSFPSWIPLQSLQYLKIHHGGFKTLWKNRIQVPSQLKSLDIANCNHLKNVSGISNLEKLVFLNIDQCPKLKEVTLGHLSFLERVTIVDCKKLRSVSGASDFRSLAQLSISECPELEELMLAHLSCLERITIEGCNHLKRVSLSGMKWLESTTFDRNVKIKSYRVPSCVESIIIDEYRKLTCLQLHACPNLRSVSEFGVLKVTSLNISKRPDLKLLPDFRSLSCVERTVFDGYGLKLYGCPDLRSVSIQCYSIWQRVEGAGNLTKIIELYISDCPELEEFAGVSSMNFLKKFEIDNCNKLQNIILPTTLISLSIRNCRDLQRVGGINDLTKLTELYIKECPELEDLLSLSSIRCLERIVIDSCEKVNKMASTRELHALISMRLFYCSNTIIQNCIPRLKTVESDYTLVIGRAVDEAESTLNEHMFYDADIAADAVTNIFTEIGAENSDKLENWQELITVIVCCVVVVDSYTSVEDINKSLPRGPSYYTDTPVMHEGEWIITMVAPYGCSSYYYHYFMKIEEVLRRFGIMKKGFLAEVKKDEEWKGSSTLIKLVELNISQCPELEELTLGHLESLERITIADCKHLKNVSATSNLVKLVELNISQCLELEELTLGHLKSLETVTIADCKHLTNVSGTYIFLE